MHWHAALSAPLLLLLLLLLLPAAAQAFQHGAPLAACDTLLPDMSYYGGHQTMPNQTDSPFVLEAFNHLSHLTYEYTPGSKMAITVQLRGPIYRGFILQARTLHGAGSRRIGQFVPPLPAGTKFLHCDPQQHSQHAESDYTRHATTVTHSNWRNKKQLRLFWYAPAYDVGPIVFVATVVAHKQLYWTNVMSPVLHPFTSKIQVATDTCGIGFGCIQAGHSGCAATNTCDYTIRWKCHGDQTFFDFVANKTHRFTRYVNVDAPSDAFLGLSWRGNSLLCRYSLAQNGSRAVSVNNYFMPDTADEVYIDTDNVPRATKLRYTPDGRYQCSFQRKNLMFQRRERVYFTYGTITQDGWIASIRRIDLGLYGVDSQVRLCKHPSLSLALPASAASAYNAATPPATGRLASTSLLLLLLPLLLLPSQTNRLLCLLCFLIYLVNR